MDLGDQEQQRMVRAMLEEDLDEIIQMVRRACALSQAEWPDARLRAQTRFGLDRAVAHDLIGAPDVMHFLILRHTIAERFDEFPAVKKFLARTDLPPTGKIELMMLELPLGIWEVVQRWLK